LASIERRHNKILAIFVLTCVVVGKHCVIYCFTQCRLCTQSCQIVARGTLPHQLAGSTTTCARRHVRVHSALQSLSSSRRTQIYLLFFFLQLGLRHSTQTAPIFI